MKFVKFALTLTLIIGAGNALACESVQDGCMGCNDEQLPVCLRALVKDICESAGSLANCDQQRVYDDAERHILISTGRHMSRIRSMSRSARKYQHR